MQKASVSAGNCVSIRIQDHYRTVSYTHLDVYKRQGKTQRGCLAENDFKYKS